MTSCFFHSRRYRLPVVVPISLCLLLMISSSFYYCHAFVIVSDTPTTSLTQTMNNKQSIIRNKWNRNNNKNNNISMMNRKHRMLCSMTRTSREDSNNNNGGETYNNNNNNNDSTSGITTTTTTKLSRPERKALERTKKQQVGSTTNSNSSSNKRRKHNFKERQDLLLIVDTPIDSMNQVTKSSTGSMIQLQEDGTESDLGSPDRRSSSTSTLYELHSTTLPELCPNRSTPNDVMKAIKRAQNLHDVHDLYVIHRFLVDSDTQFAYGFKGSLFARLAVAAYHLNEVTIAHDAVQIRDTMYHTTKLPMESAAIIRGMLRHHNVTSANQILETDLALPNNLPELIQRMKGGVSGVEVNNNDDNKTNDVVMEMMTDVEILALQDLIVHRTLSLVSITSRHFFEDEPYLAVQACIQLGFMGPIIRETNTMINVPWTRLIQGAAQCQSNMNQPRRHQSSKNNNNNNSGGGDATTSNTATKLPCHLVYAVLNALTTFPSENDDKLYEMLANTLVRRVCFVTGTVNSAGLPLPDRGEAAFIGRSNVGKSSLINMLTNRKTLAYTSKRPGKTQQLNYFAVNDKPGREKEIRYGDVVPGQPDPDTFYLVDLPGFGYAKVPEPQRIQWLQFMHEYLEYRSTLRVIFHLIDSRIGPTIDDGNIMEQIRQYLPKTVTYVIVLTKADKNIKNNYQQQQQQQQQNNNNINSSTATTLVSGSGGGLVQQPKSILKQQQQQLLQQNMGPSRGKVSKTVMNTLRSVMQQKGIGNAPVLLSSAETKLGRDDIWRYLRFAAEG